MRYPTVDLGEAKRVLEAWRNGAALEPSVHWQGSEKAPRFDVDLVEDVVEALHDLRRELGEPEDGPRNFWAMFEGRAAELVHELLELPALIATDHEFWLWFVFGSGHEAPGKLVSWRHVSADSPFGTQDANFGLTTDLEKGFFSRLWLRAHLLHDPSAADPYEYAKRGSQDLWRSHLFRTEYGMVPVVAKAFLRFAFPDEDPDRASVPNDVLRAMAKELRRRNATSAFELLDDESAQSLMKAVYEDVA